MLVEGRWRKPFLRSHPLWSRPGFRLMNREHPLLAEPVVSSLPMKGEISRVRK